MITFATELLGVINLHWRTTIAVLSPSKRLTSPLAATRGFFCVPHLVGAATPSGGIPETNQWRTL